MSREDLALSALLDVLDACEAGIITAKRRIRDAKVKDPKNLDSDKLNWTTKEGTKGAYEQTSKNVNNNSTAFQELQKKTKEKGGFMQHQGYKFWFHKDDEDVIDRRKI